MCLLKEETPVPDRLWLTPGWDNSKIFAWWEFALFVFSDIFSKLHLTSNYLWEMKWIFEIPPAFKIKPDIWSYLCKISFSTHVALKYSNSKPQKIQIELSNLTYSFCYSVCSASTAFESNKLILEMFSSLLCCNSCIFKDTIYSKILYGE